MLQVAGLKWGILPETNSKGPLKMDGLKGMYIRNHGSHVDYLNGCFHWMVINVIIYI